MTPLPVVQWWDVAEAAMKPLDADALRAVVAAEAAERSVAGDMVVNVAFQRWGELDGAGALAAADGLDGTERVERINFVMRGWVRVAPQVAWEQLRQLSGQFADRRYELGYPLTAIAEQDLAQALADFTTVVPQRQCLECLAKNISLVAFARGQSEVIRATIAKLPDGEHRSALRDVYWDFVGGIERGQGWARASSWGGDQDRRAAELNELGGWARVDFSGSFAQAAQLQPPSRRDAALGAVLHAWGQGARSSELAGIIARLPDDLGEQAALGLAYQFANLNPAATMTWAESLPTPALRTEMQRRVIRVWTEIDPGAARAYLHAQTDLELRGVLVWAYLSKRVSNYTLTPADLDEVSPGFGADWTVRALTALAVDLVDPANEAETFISREAFKAEVKARTDLTPDQQAAVLAPLGRD